MAKLPPCGRPLPTTHHQTGWKDRLRQHLQEKGLKHSDQRLQIAEAVQRFNTHFSTQDVVEAVQERAPGIGAATVYRNIKTLVEAGLVTETLLDEQGRTVFERAGDDEQHHDHIVCNDCGAILEFIEPRIEQLQDDLTAKLKFRPVRHRHVIYASCEYGAKGKR
jgi:Fur family ferric uptake transcriptional regulator